mmetsp:Transcript_16917/g.42477  ORF Transcript_16917/g.42477 Transcript_16917/m.42477 type:complete len:121 (-) Transcript_16917:136-498(-)
MQVETSGAAEADLMDEAEAGAMDADDSDEDGGLDLPPLKAKSGQNSTLYSEEGQFNPHAARKARKAAKKAAATAEEYDFAEHEWEDGMEEAAASDEEGDEEGDEDGDDDEEEESGEEMEG